MIRFSLCKPYIFLAGLVFFCSRAGATVVRMDIAIGSLPVEKVYIELFDREAPVTVANFLNYIDNGSQRRYDGTFIHRSSPGFVVQGGGYAYNPSLGDFSPDSAPHITEDPPIVNEFDPARSNLNGTIAMAKLAGDPDSATSEWFINLADNSANLDTQNGGFTVFGRVLGDGMRTINKIAALPNDHYIIAPFTELPLQDHVNGDPVTGANLVRLVSIQVTDSDGIPDAVESAGPNGGDGNNDGIADYRQDNVASFMNENGDYVTLETDPSLKLFKVVAEVTPPPELLPSAKGADLKFIDGFYSFFILDVPVGGTATATLHLPAGHTASSYFKFGNTPGDTPIFTPPHWYQFDFNGATGARFVDNRVVLSFVDGGWGDSDIIADGVITDPGGPAAISLSTGGSSSGGGGCALLLRSRTQPVPPADFGVLLLALIALRMLRGGLRPILLQNSVETGRQSWR